MEKSLTATVLFSCTLLISLFVSSSAQTCGTFTFSNSQTYSNCTNLPQLNCSLHWNYHPSNTTADIAFRKTGASTSNWIAWALNPSGARMAGSQALVAYRRSNGTLYTYTATVDGSGNIVAGSLSFEVPSISVDYSSGGDMTIFATLKLNSSLVSTYQVWQEGPLSGDTPARHATTGENMLSAGNLNFGTGSVNSSVVSSSAQTCGTYTFSNSQTYSNCTNLPQLNCSLHWNYHPSNMTADIAFRKTGALTSNWIAWALNPSGARMAGSQALVAYRRSNGTLYAYTATVDGSGNMVAGSLSFEVPSITADYSSGGDMTIFATLKLTSSLVSTSQVWQEGALLSGDTPGPHPTTGENGQSVGTLNFATGSVTSNGVSNPKDRKRNVHGVLNAVSWGILMPVGIIIARYLKVFKSVGPAWFYLHAICQTSGYAVGVAGWATGMKLGSDSPGITYKTHRNLGITIFALGTLQVLALLLRPKPDHKYRLYWNIYHHTIGYTTVILSIINIFEGFDALDREKNWKKAYIGVLIFLGSVAVVLEAVTWMIVIKRKKTASSDKHANGVNGYGSRVQQTA